MDIYLLVILHKWLNHEETGQKTPTHKHPHTCTHTHGHTCDITGFKGSHKRSRLETGSTVRWRETAGDLG